MEYENFGPRFLSNSAYSPHSTANFQQVTFESAIHERFRPHTSESGWPLLLTSGRDTMTLTTDYLLTSPPLNHTRLRALTNCRIQPSTITSYCGEIPIYFETFVTISVTDVHCPCLTTNKQTDKQTNKHTHWTKAIPRLISPGEGITFPQYISLPFTWGRTFPLPPPPSANL